MAISLVITNDIRFILWIIKACKVLIPFLPPTLKVGFQYVYFRSLLPLLSVDVFILAIIVKLLGCTELYSDARRDVFGRHDLWPHKTYSLAKVENTHVNQPDKTT